MRSLCFSHYKVLPTVSCRYPGGSSQAMCLVHIYTEAATTHNASHVPDLFPYALLVERVWALAVFPGMVSSVTGIRSASLHTGLDTLCGVLIMPLLGACLWSLIL